MIGAHAVIEIAEIGVADAAAGDGDGDFAWARRRDESLAHHRLFHRCHHPTMRRDSLSHVVSLFFRQQLVCQLRSVPYFGKLVQKYQISKSDFRTCLPGPHQRLQTGGRANEEASIMMKSPSEASLSIVLTGSGGAGVMTAGQILLDAATNCGLYGFMTRSTGPQIRGGEAAAMIRLSSKPVQSPGDRFDILLALDFENVQRFADELPLDTASLIIADPAAGEMPGFLKNSGATIGLVPMSKLAKGVKGGRVAMVDRKSVV